MRASRSNGATGNPLALCTIVSKNYLPQARALYESARATNPDCLFFALLVDRPEGHFDPKAEPFPIVPIEALPIPDLPRFLFQYTILELNTAAKPFFLRFLMENYGVRKLVYLDPDILVLDSLRPLAELLDRCQIVLTPHLTSALPEDRCTDQEISILQSGTYNLGFIGVVAGPTTERFLAWWSDRLARFCVSRPEQGLFVDQKWIDLVPGLFPDVHILSEPGYNIAYWNIGSRRVTFPGDRILVNGQPGYFFHFSGFSPRKLDTICKWHDWFTMASAGEARRLYLDYAQRLIRHGYHDCIGWPYAYGRFDNGVPISDLVRKIYWELDDRAQGFGNPFCTEAADSYFRWLAASGSNQGKWSNLFPSRASLRSVFLRILRKAAPGVYRRLRACLGRSDAKAASPTSPVRGDPVLHQRAEPFRQSLADARKPQREARPSARARVPVVPSGTAASERPFGVNLAGYFQSETGMGEAARAVIRALRAAEIPFVLNNVNDASLANRDSSAGEFAATNPYAFNVVQVNADQAVPFAQARPHYFQGHHNIGCWNWELAEFPAEWRQSFDLFDEIWAPSTFTQKAVAAASPIPVHCVPLAVAVPDRPPLGVGRGRFRLPPDAFVFFFAFDFGSFMERKNPQAVVEAFRRAFGSRADVHLVLKTLRGAAYAAGRDRLQAACQGQANITLLDEVLTRPEMHGLMSCCDAYVSLHRCEGFGLTLAEAMALGKPVIASLYSANTDFMDATNCCPVRYRMVEIAEDHGPYRRGQVWADPDVAHAAEWMRRLVEDRSAALRIGDKARRDIAEQLSAQRIGEITRAALADLARRKGEQAPSLRSGSSFAGHSWLSLRGGMANLVRRSRAASP